MLMTMRNLLRSPGSGRAIAFAVANTTHHATVPSAKGLLLFALPTLVLPLADPMMSVIDTACIGSYGTVVELAATGPASLLFAAASQLFSAFAATALADISRALSKGDKESASFAFGRAVRDAVVGGTVHNPQRDRVTYEVFMFRLRDPHGCVDAQA
jgi:Na+-driven multidrug efflux pump